MQEIEIDGIHLKSTFRRDGSLLLIGYDGRFIQPIRLAPKLDARFSKQGLHHFDGDLAEHFQGLHASAHQLIGRRLPDTRQLRDL